MNQSSTLMISVSGIRGIVGESLTPEAVVTFARALGTYLEGKAVVVGRDSRPSGPMLEAAAIAGLLSCGCLIKRLGIVPTPTVGVAICELGAGGGIQITASHNPSPYNGLKLFGPRGMVLTAAEGTDVVRIHTSGQFRPTSYQTTCHDEVIAEPAAAHLERILKQVDVSKIQHRRFRILIDANGGAGGPMLLELLDRLSWQHLLTTIGCEADGQFTHEPEPTEENLSEVAPLVAENNCAVGFALDPDADRLALIDEHGQYIGEELTLALATEFRLRQQPGPVVVNMSTSRVIEDIAARHSCAFHRSAVGEANVVERMLEIGAVIGGEGNGGVIDPRVGLVRDPFIGMALILSLLAETGKTVSQLVSELPTYHIFKTKKAIERPALPSLYDQLAQRWSEAKVNREDGLRLDWPDRWVHVRPSNTEPIVRVIAEAPTLAAAQALAGEVISF
jgi:phosphomannomutase